MAKKKIEKITAQSFTENSVAKGDLLPKEEFLRKFKISTVAFDSANLKWSTLQKIHADYIANKDFFESTTNSVVAKFLANDAKEFGVHSVRSRIKSPDSLIEKIIRKTLEAKKKGVPKNITVKNYTSEIRDLIGIRVLHVFKNEWFNIHNFIVNICCFTTKEKPIAYHRKGDEKSFIDECKKHDCEAKVHPKGYRSIHYIITPTFPNKKIIGYAEIQVRTVFEDGWSEIDHKLRYASKKGTKHELDSYLLALNRIAGSADEIGTIIKNRQIELRQNEYERGIINKGKR